MGYSPQGHKEVDTTERLSTHRDELFIIFIFGCAGSSLCGVVVCRLSCSVACGMLVPQQGLNLSPLHWKADSQPLDQQGNPKLALFCCKVSG